MHARRFGSRRRPCVTGIVTIGYKDFNPVDPLVEPFRGLIGSAG